MRPFVWKIQLGGLQKKIDWGQVSYLILIRRAGESSIIQLGRGGGSKKGFRPAHQI